MVHLQGGQKRERKPKWSFQSQPKNNYLRSSSKRSVECFSERKEKQEGCSSEKERKENALALKAEEGRDNLRKAAASWK